MKVRVIDETGKQLGILSLTEATQIAREKNLDLIQFTEKVEPPVCKIMDYGKYLYLEEKKEKTAFKKQKGSEIKGVRLSFGISAHDLETRARQADKFLKEGDKVRIAKFKAKTGYRRVTGFRPQLTLLEVEKITS